MHHHPSAKFFVLVAITALFAMVWSTRLERERNGLPPNGANKEKLAPVLAPQVAPAPSVREAWTSSRVIGSPEPPPPYKTVRVFDKLAFNHPTVLVTAPGSKRLFVCEQSGQIVSFLEENAAVEKADPVIDLKRQLKSIPADSKISGVGELYGLAFHPQFEQNHFAYVCYTVNSKTSGEQLPDGTRVSRFVVSNTEPPTFDPDSEKILFTWLGGGHNGGCLVFGPDNYLYITSGDGSFPNPPDARLAGQNVSEVLSAVLRIDVDHEQDGRPYRIPDDNPFVNISGARGEIWAHGFRNPWKITFDRATGDLWLGDVGWESFELIDRVVKGGNYGWSIVEGLQPVRPDAKRGPTPILPPTIALPHSEAASVTGGYVYRGKQFPELVGKYIFGDWETRRMWAATWDGEKVTARTEIVEPTLRIVTYAENRDGELYVVDYDDGTIHQFAKNDAPPDQGEKFPRKLSETGLFENSPLASQEPARQLIRSLGAKGQRPAPGVIPFEINAPMWADGATAHRWLALPDNTSVKWHREQVPIAGTIFNRFLEFPTNAVLAKTLSIETERGKADSRRNIETQLLHFDGRRWRGYSYRWNDEQTDADLVAADGDQQTIAVVDEAAPGGRRELNWTFHGRAACARCHNSWAQHTLAFNIPQLNHAKASGAASAPRSGDKFTGRLTPNGAHFVSGKALAAGNSPENADPESPVASAIPLKVSAIGLTPPQSPVHDDENQLASLAQLGVIVPAKDELDPAKLPSLVNPLDESKPLDARARTYLQANCAHCHQMGGTGTADIELRFDKPIELTKTLERKPLQGSFKIEKAQLIAPGDPYRSVLFYRVANEGKGHMPITGSETVDDVGVKLLADWIRSLPPRNEDHTLLARLRELDGSAAAHAKERSEIIGKLLSTPSRALLLSRELIEKPLPDAVQQDVLKAAWSHTDPQVKDLFDRFLPADQRPKKLGSIVRPEKLLALTGEAARGRELFFRTAGVNCKVCHKVGAEGGSVGPDLTLIGKKYDKSKLLESLLEPSKVIDPKFVAYLAQTDDGKVVTGLLLEQTPDHVVLRNTQGQDVKLAMSTVEVLLPQRQSLMPELLLKDLTIEQVADLLAFLESLK